MNDSHSFHLISIGIIFSHLSMNDGANFLEAVSPSPFYFLVPTRLLVIGQSSTLLETVSLVSYMQPVEVKTKVTYNVCQLCTNFNIASKCIELLVV